MPDTDEVGFNKSSSYSFNTSMEISAIEVLAKRSDLSSHQLQFLNEHFKSHNDLTGDPPRRLLSELTTSCSGLDHLLENLQRNLTKQAVSWISHSLKAKSRIRNIDMGLKDLGVCISQYETDSKGLTKMITTDEVPQLVRELRRIENLRQYVDTALKLETLVGDLEDAVFNFMNHHKGNMFSAKVLSPLSRVIMASYLHFVLHKDFVSRQESCYHAIKAMNEIEEIVSAVIKSQPQWHNLIDSVESRANKSLSVLRPQVLAEHRALLASVGWPPKLTVAKIENAETSSIPNPLLLMQGDKKESYFQSFLVLCALQHIQARREVRQLKISTEKEKGLWAINELVSLIASRVEYHFLKWVEQPEFIFALVYKITRDFGSGVGDVLQPLIDKARLVSYSAKEAWVSAIVHMVSGFLTKKIFPLLAERYKEKHMRSEVTSSWLHLVDLIVAFDKKMDSLLISETNLFWGESERNEEALKGISVMVVFADKPEWLKIWAKIELKNSWRQLKIQLEDEKAWFVINKVVINQYGTDLDQSILSLSTREDHKAPLVAESALKLTWNLIERGLTLPATLSRILFIRATAARFLWYFLKFMLWRCKKIDFSLEYHDKRALIKFCGLINTAQYVESKLQEWNDDVRFVEMKLAESNFNLHPEIEGIHESCFFGEEVNSFTELETNWLLEIITSLLREFETLSRRYFQSRQHFDEEKDGVVDFSVSTILAEALDTLRRQLHVLKLSLNSKDFRDLWRNVAQGLDHFITRNIFTDDVLLYAKGINQFGVDMEAVFVVFQPFCVRPEGFFPCIRETLKLVKMNTEEVMHLNEPDCRNSLKGLNVFGITHLSLDQIDKVLRYKKLRN